MDDSWEQTEDRDVAMDPVIVVFNAADLPTQSPLQRNRAAKLLYTNEPVILLQADFWAARHIAIESIDPTTNIRTFRKPPIELPESQSQLFGHRSKSDKFKETRHEAWWRYAAIGCTIRRISGDDAYEGGDDVLTRRPVQPRSFEERERQLSDPGTAKEQKIWLFNVIVAFEVWPLDSVVQKQLDWLCRQASDFLADVTDGYAAFGTIVLGGPELMPYADIQVFASNRLFPRAWVGGMYIERKYSPIRIGRGLWNKNRRITAPWDEPEAYRTLIHEWAHYALGLRDRYLEQKKVVLAEKTLLGYFEDEAEEHKQWRSCTLAVPTISIAVESIMSTTEGTSELTPRTSYEQKSDWEVLKESIPWLGLDPDREIDAGPGRLTLPLPIVLSQSEGDQKRDLVYLVSPVWDAKGKLVWPETSARPRRLPTSDMVMLPIRNDAFNTAMPNQKGPFIRSSHCWVYVLKESGKLIAQGSVEDRLGDEGFRLSGARVGDTIILIGNDKNDKEEQPTVLSLKLTESTIGTAPQQWTSVTPKVFPMVDVIPVRVERGRNDRQISYTVKVNITEAGWRATIYPLGAIEKVRYEVSWGDGESETSTGQVSDAISKLPSLDGHILLQRIEGEKLEQVIATYSIGGSPANAWPVPPNPISAGSSEGNALLFFNEKKETAPYLDQDDNEITYGDYLVVTTFNHGIAKPADAAPRSYVFSIATNKPLLVGKNATLVLFYDRDSLKPKQQLTMMRWSGKKWEDLPTFVGLGRSYAATPLFGTGENRFTYHNSMETVEPTAQQLFDMGNGPYVERYRLCVRDE